MQNLHLKTEYWKIPMKGLDVSLNVSEQKSKNIVDRLLVSITFQNTFYYLACIFPPRTSKNSSYGLKWPKTK